MAYWQAYFMEEVSVKIESSFIKRFHKTFTHRMLDSTLTNSCLAYLRMLLLMFYHWHVDVIIIKRWLWSIVLAQAFFQTTMFDIKYQSSVNYSALYTLWGTTYLRLFNPQAHRFNMGKVKAIFGILVNFRAVIHPPMSVVITFCDIGRIVDYLECYGILTLNFG